MRVVLIGPPGSGKGTQGTRLRDRLSLEYIATGNILRDAVAHKSAAGLEAKPYLDRGQLVPDELVNRLVAELFSGPTPLTRFVMDGYPRTLAQAKAFDELLESHGLPLTAAIQFVIPDEEVIRRLDGRRMCDNNGCGAVYHIKNNPPAVPGICDRCGAPLSQRLDDKENDAIRARLKAYHQVTEELVEYYQKQGVLHRIQAQQDIELIHQQLVEVTQESA
jgi:adenylate kinase